MELNVQWHSCSLCDSQSRFCTTNSSRVFHPICTTYHNGPSILPNLTNDDDKTAWAFLEDVIGKES